MTDNTDPKSNKNNDAGFINKDLHTLAEPGLLSSNGHIAPAVGKPNKQTWFKSHPSYEIVLTMCKGRVGGNGKDKEYLVQGETDDIHAKLVENLDGVYAARCVLTCNTSGHYSIWCMKISTGDNEHIAHETARKAWIASKTDFTKMWYGGNDSGYQWKHPVDIELYRKQEPVWPDEQSWDDILGKAFKPNTISNEDHPVYCTAIGTHH